MSTQNTKVVAYLGLPAQELHWIDEWLTSLVRPGVHGMAALFHAVYKHVYVACIYMVMLCFASGFC